MPFAMGRGGIDGITFVTTCCQLVVLYAVVTPLLTVWVHADCTSRGIDPAGWVAFVAIFTVPAALLYLCCRPRRKVESCWNCDEPVAPGRTVCPHCGKPSCVPPRGP
jgi:hypothetical protein